MSQVIQKIETGKFKVFWQEKPSDIIALDFNPLMDGFNLREKPFILLHWQAIPIGFRRFGVYDCLRDKYTGIDYDKISFINTQCTLAQIPDSHFANKPTAVIVYKGYMTIQNNGVIIVKGG